MGVAVKQHIMQAVDWSKYSFEDWCRQLGAWINGDNEKIVRVVKVMPTKRITQKQREELLAKYMNNEALISSILNRRTGTCCKLDCNEARAIHRVFLDIECADDEILTDWISAIWSHYVMGNSIREIANSNDTYISQIQQDIKCGMAFIKSRYPNFSFEKFKKKEVKDDGA